MTGEYSKWQGCLTRLYVTRINQLVSAIIFPHYISFIISFILPGAVFASVFSQVLYMYLPVCDRDYICLDVATITDSGL